MNKFVLLNYVFTNNIDLFINFRKNIMSVVISQTSLKNMKLISNRKISHTFNLKKKKICDQNLDKSPLYSKYIYAAV